MLDFEMDVPLREAEFVPERTLGNGPLHIASRVSLGDVDGWPVTAARIGDDPELAATLAESGDFDFYLLAFACTMLGREQEVIHSATFTAVMSSEGSGPGPIARSLDPLILDSKPLQITNSLSPKVGVKVAGILSGGLNLGHSVKGEKAQPYVRAGGLRESDPEWVFTRNKTDSLDGTQTMKLVAQVPRGQNLTVECTLRAQISHPLFGVTFVRVAFKDPKDAQPRVFSVGGQV